MTYTYVNYLLVPMRYGFYQRVTDEISERGSVSLVWDCEIILYLKSLDPSQILKYVH